MRKDQEPVTSIHRFSGATAIGTLALLMILSFAGCASGSCLSYGHSCWGAHGKRSNNGPEAQLHRSNDARRDGGDLVAEVETDESDPAPRNHERWILSRLITGRLTVPAPVLTAGKRRGNRWHETQNIVTFPGNWNTDFDITRDRNAENSDDIEDVKNYDDSLDLTRKLVEHRAENTELLWLPSRNDFDSQPSRSHKIRLFKILADASDDKLK